MAMSVGSLGFFGSIAATPAAQRGADTDRAQQDTVRQQGEAKSDLQAEKAAGIGETDGDEHDANERDADGRRPWEIGPRANKEEAALTSEPTPPRLSKDATGASGSQLDLTG
jgi:hypothetical protein